MTSAGSVVGDERLRLFLALELPPGVLETIERWQNRHLSGGRKVPRDHLHVTLAFLGSRPAFEVDEIVAALRACAAGVTEPSLEPSRWHETRSVGMLVLDDRQGTAEALARSLHERLEALGVYRPERRRWLPHTPSFASASGRSSRRRCPRRERSFRPVLLLTFPVCTRPAFGTRCSIASR
ncbi:MAG: hypothetical protein H0W16_06925 [Actinobacteria bacterium]|nr:hypothetical protein [Actinomycetota bacterium]